VAVLHNARAGATARDRCLRLLAYCLKQCHSIRAKHVSTATMIVVLVDASMPVALCLYGTGVLTLDGAHHGNKATNSNREYIEHVFTIAVNIFAMGLFCM
jgi:hypothetical protein